MNWDALGAVGEVGGAVAVVATLGYLAAQIRQNTRAMHSATTREVTSTAGNNLILMALDGEFAEIMWRSNGPQPLAPSEHMRITWWYRGVFRNFENQYYQRRQGYLEEVWEGLEHTLSLTCRLPYVRAWWPGNRDSFGASFRDLVDRLIADLPADAGATDAMFFSDRTAADP